MTESDVGGGCRVVWRLVYSRILVTMIDLCREETKICLGSRIRIRKANLYGIGSPNARGMEG